MDTRKPDLDSPESIDSLVDAFYAQLLADPILAPIFIDVAEVDLAQHLPHIKAYWRKLLLGDRTYQRHTMAIHRQLHSRRPLQAEDFQRWLDYFECSVDSAFAGEKAEQAKRVAARIAENMAARLS